MTVNNLPLFWRRRLRKMAGHWPTLAGVSLAATLVVALVLLASGRPATAAERLGARFERAAGLAAKSSGQLPLKVPAAEFASVGETGQYAYSRSGGYLYAYDDNRFDGKVKGVCLRAPVYLPDGVQVDGFRAYVMDGDEAADISRIELLRAPYRSTAGTELLAAMRTTGVYIAPNHIQLVSAPSVDPAKVDNDLYSYLALVCMDGTEAGSTLRLYALVIDYGFKAFVPQVSGRS